MLCVLSSHPFWMPAHTFRYTWAGQPRSHRRTADTGLFSSLFHLSTSLIISSVMLALFFIAKGVRLSGFLVDRAIEFCVLTTHPLSTVKHCVRQIIHIYTYSTGRQTVRPHVVIGNICEMRRALFLCRMRCVACCMPHAVCRMLESCCPLQSAQQSRASDQHTRLITHDVWTCLPTT